MNDTQKKLLCVALLVLLAIVITVALVALFRDGGGLGNFTDGKLDMTLYWSKSAADGDWHSASRANAKAIFDYDNWQPRHSEIRYFKIVNSGELDFKYNFLITPDGEVGALSETIDVYFADRVTWDASSAYGFDLIGSMKHIGSLRDLIEKDTDPLGTVTVGGERVVAIMLIMRDDAGNAYMNDSIGDSFSVSFDATSVR